MKRKIAKKKLTVLLIILAFIFAVLLARLAYLQLIETHRYQVMARDNLVRVIPITAPRGEIRDRNGELLVDNKPVYTLSLYFFGVSEKQQKEVENLLAQILQQDKNVGRAASWWLEEISTRLGKQTRPFEPVRIAKDVTWETVVQVRERQTELPGVIVEEEPVRNYPHGDMLAHVLGYVREMSDQQLEIHRENGYTLGDNFGQDGLENTFEKYLCGEKGARQVEVDANGRPVDLRGLMQPVPGSNLVLTIDSRLQKAAEQALVDGVARAKRNGYSNANGGAAVVLDVNTGEVLAMASYPTYNPSIFADRLSEENWAEVNKNNALVNRALWLYPPGSVFKMITGAAILENNVVDPEHTISDPGYYMLGRTRFNDWRPGGHGRVNFIRSLQVSCNTYYYQYGRAVGQPQISRFAKEFGLGQKTGIELPGEQAGVVPTPEYKYENTKAYLIRYNNELASINRKYESLINEAASENKKEKLRKERDKKINDLLIPYSFDLNWQTFDTLNMSIGQGYNSYTPLQLANMTAAIANGGTLYKPYIVRKIMDINGMTEMLYQPTQLSKVDISEESLALIQEGMHMVSQPPDGTAVGIFSGYPLTAAAKTGTAEVAGHDNHALFVSYVPYEKPEIAVAVVMEYAGSGSSAAGLVVRDILDAYYDITRGSQETEREASEGQAETVQPPDNAQTQQPQQSQRQPDPPAGGNEQNNGNGEMDNGNGEPPAVDPPPVDPPPADPPPVEPPPVDPAPPPQQTPALPELEE